MIARSARQMADDARAAEALLDTWPVTPEAVGKAQAVLSCLRIALGAEADSLLVEEMSAFGELL